MTKIGLIIILLVVVFLFLRSVYRPKNLPLASPLGVPPLCVPPFASPEQTDFQKFVERIWYNGDIRGE